MSYRQHIDTLIRLQNGRCRYCGTAMRGKPNSPTEPTVDHIVPQSRGGSDEIINLVAACRSCNSSKGAMSHAEFMTHQRARKHPKEYVHHEARANHTPGFEMPNINWPALAVGLGFLLGMVAVIWMN